MIKDKSGKYKFIVYSLILALLTPLVSARTGVGVMDKGIEMIGNIFNIRILQTSSIAQAGFLKFSLFIVMFAVTNMALKKTKIFDNKTAGIIAFAFSMIGVFMMPTPWLMATGGTITAIMSASIFIGLFWGLAWVAMFTLRPKEENEPYGWVRNLLGILLLFILLSMIDDFAIAAGVKLSLVMLIQQDWLRKKLTKQYNNK